MVGLLGHRLEDHPLFGLAQGREVRLVLEVAFHHLDHVLGGKRRMAEAQLDVGHR